MWNLLRFQLVREVHVNSLFDIERIEERIQELKLSPPRKYIMGVDYSGDIGPCSYVLGYLEGDVFTIILTKSQKHCTYSFKQEINNLTDYFNAVKKEMNG